MHNAARADSVTCNQTLQEDDMELGTIEREIYVEASPEIVFDVVSSHDHLKNWWPDDARYEPTPGSAGPPRTPSTMSSPAY